IKTLISSSDTVMSTYARQDRAISTILDDLDSVGGSLNGMTSDIDSLIVNFAQVQQQLDRLLKQNRGNIDATIGEFEVLTRLLQGDRGKLAETLCSLPAGLSGYFQ